MRNKKKLNADSKGKKNRYPKNWTSEIRPAILKRAKNRCEGSPNYPNCKAENHQPHPVTKSIVVLTIAHLDHTPENCQPDNLRAWCQLCHLTYDAPRKAKDQRRKTELSRLKNGEIFLFS